LGDREGSGGKTSDVLKGTIRRILSSAKMKTSVRRGGGRVTLTACDGGEEKLATLLDEVEGGLK